ncbi:uncharacterized protein J8A68_003875 [[Candida] subhashii]|uniref:Metallo-beta-lactamase domain-containing protein n=1 Tax=[Candida] subhashii TaxID=561895 RepID=A0A8J5QIA5_9ASCO|nr:uncharacterized protein J8A68_003875 [[Candida] subhashii]KAG7662578.1 hypothetical protein J8A68_003875 [[Candida] subhashii]
MQSQSSPYLPVAKATYTSIRTMSSLTPLSLKFKIGMGLLATYTSFELYMHLRTQYLIRSRHREYEKFRANNKDLKDLDISKFKSESVSGMFVNPFEEYRPQTAFEFIFVRIMELVESIYGSRIEIHQKLPHPHDGAVEVEDLLKVFKPDLERFRNNSKIFQECCEKNDFKPLFTEASKSWLLAKPTLPSLNQQLLFSWLGQSCTFFQIGGINFLTDPIVSDHLITPKIGPKRLTKSAMTFEDIEYASNDNLNFVLVSHDHPDHLEYDLAKKIRNETTWIVPLGLKKKLNRKGIYRVIEMDWWDTLDITKYISNHENFPGKYEIECVPSMHWSGRYVFDSNKSLWCSYVIKRNGESIVYHAGDTGYSKELFDVIGSKIGPVTLALLPIGQYCPSWHQKPRHISPEESLKICSHLSATFMKGIHWGTFKLSSEPILEPRETLTELSEKLGKSAYFRVPEFGLTYLYDLQNKTEIEIHV